MGEDSTFINISIQKWFPNLERLIDGFGKWLIKIGIDGKYIKLDKINREDYENEYAKLLREVKSFAFNDKIDVNRIDQHKIVSIYVLIILRKQPISYIIPEGSDINFGYPPKLLEIANEILSITIAWDILLAWNNIEKSPSWIPRHYRSALLKLLHNSRHNINDIYKNKDTINSFIQPLAHIFYFLECILIKKTSIT